MKRILVILIAVMMIVSLAACGNNAAGSESSKKDDNSAQEQQTDNANGDNSQPDVSSSDASDTESSADVNAVSLKDFPNFIKQYVNPEHYDGKEYDSSYSFSIKHEYAGEYQKSANVHLLQQPIALEDNTVIDLEMTYSDFSAQGWTVVKKSALDAKIEPNKMLTGIYSEHNGKVIRVLWANSTDSTITIEKAVVGSFYIESYDYDDNYLTRLSDATDYLIEGKISSSSGISDILETLGEPRDISYVVKKNNSYITLDYLDLGGTSIYFDLSADGNTIYRVYAL